jgi:ankyrin repeat protein
MQEKINFLELARGGKLNTIDPKFLTEKNLTTKDKNEHGNTPLHYAAQNKCLIQIPQEILTEKNLLICNDSGNNVIHWAAVSRGLNQIPQEILTEKNLQIKTQNGSDVFMYTARNGGLHQLPYISLVKNKNYIIELATKDEYDEAIQFAKVKYREEIKNKIPQTIRKKLQ